MAGPNRGTFMAGTAAAFASIGILRAPAKAAEFEYKLGTNVPLNDARNVNAIIMARNVLKQTGGRLNIKIYPNGQLGGDTAMLSQIRSGALEFFTVSPGILAGVVPVAGIEGIPFAFKSVANAFEAFDGALGTYVRGEIEAKGIVVMPKMLDNGFRQVTNSLRPIKTVDDLAGLKIRTPPGKLWVDLFKTFGAIPVALNFAELYTALQTHVVDAQENPYSIIEIGRLYDVQKYLSVTNHMWGGYWIVANLDAWKALGPEIQAIVTKNMNLYSLNQRRDNALFNAAMEDKLQRRGMKFNHADVNSLKARLRDSYGRWKADYGTTAWELLERYTGKLG